MPNFFASRLSPVVALAFAFALVAAPRPAFAQDASPYAIDIPPWFAQSFLDFREDVAEAAREGKRVMIYVGQDGCPYCRKLMTANFSQRETVAKTRAGFVPIALNLWGDRETTWVDGRTGSEKELARRLDVQFTPTMLFLDERGEVVVRLDGYWPPQRFDAVLDYVAAKRERVEPLEDWLARNVREAASPKLHDESFFLPAAALPRTAPAPGGKATDVRSGGRPLAVIFETVDCGACDEMHREAFRRREVLSEVARFDVVRLSLGATMPIVTPDGRATTAHAWARDLGVAYTPSIVFFDAGGAEVFRIGAYVRPFHLAASFAYVADGAYRTEPSFQRWLRERADRMRSQGLRVDLLE